MKTVGIVLVAVLMVCQGSVSANEKAWTPPKEHQYYLRVADALVTSANPRERLLAAQLLGIVLWSHEASRAAGQTFASADDGHCRSLDRLRALRARALESDDVQVLAMATQSNGLPGVGPTPEMLAGRWQEADPDNLVPMLYSGAPVEDLLGGSRAATRYDTYGYTQLQLTHGIFSRLPMTPEESAGPGWPRHSSVAERAAALAFFIKDTLLLPAFQNVVDACKEPALSSEPSRGANCLHVAKVLARESDSLIVQRIGLAMLRRAAITERDKALSALLDRNHQWQWHKSKSLWAQDDASDRPTRLLELIRTEGVTNERQLTEALMRRRDIPLVPPQDWKAPEAI